MLLNMFPVRMMLMYWSAVARLRNIPEPTVDATTLTVFFMNRTNTEVMLPSMPLAVIAPPKHMAQIMSHIVFIIPAMPRVAISSVSMALSLCRLVLPYRLIIVPSNKSLFPEISCSSSGWNIMAKVAASSVDRNRVMIEGTLRAINIPVTTGTISSHGVMWNLAFSDAVNSAICSVPLVSQANPITVKITSVMTSDGMVVIIM